MRRRLEHQGFGADHGFRWRGGDISRLEGLSDAVFAFAVTLLVVSLEVPETFDELLHVLRGFFAFAVCFAILFWVWHDHYGLADGYTTTLTGVLLFIVLFYVYPMKFLFSILFWVWFDHYRFFRRYGLADGYTTTLTGVLLFIVLFYVYPMKFLFTMLFDQLFGDARAGAIEPGQVPLLMLVYGAGFIAVQLVFILLYLRAWQLADALELTAYERLTTRSEMQGFAINVAIGLTSIAIVAVGGPDAAFWSGMAYVLIMPLQIVNGRMMGGRIRQTSATSAQP